MRIEDLDGPRIKAGAAAESLEVLQWLGIDWDEGPYYQLANLAPYQGAMKTLTAARVIYIRALAPASRSRQRRHFRAPHGEEHELRYPGTCRPYESTPLTAADYGAGAAAMRFRVPNGVIRFTDQFRGPQEFDVQQTVGDFLSLDQGRVTELSTRRCD